MLTSEGFGRQCTCRSLSLFRELMDWHVRNGHDPQDLSENRIVWGKPADPGRSGGDNRRFILALLWIVRTGSPWRDLPAFFGSDLTTGIAARVMPLHRVVHSLFRKHKIRIPLYLRGIGAQRT